jgi:D-psicose/D-tagatose/L-ribulose 3-epimerase
MRLAISNIAWDVTEDEAVAKLLAHFGVDAIDIAPPKYFSDPVSATEADIIKVRQWWSDRGVEITGMQSLLFGTVGLNMFGNTEVQDLMLAHLSEICRIGATLQAPRLVFGSPRNRDRSGLDDSRTREQAMIFFWRLGAIAASHGVVICLEPNPPRYGANFMTTSIETGEIVKLVNHSAIRMQFDTGALAISSESGDAVLEAYGDVIGHIHASEPDLKPLGDCGTNHASLHEALEKHLPGHIVSIEMVATREEPHLTSIERALSYADRFYRHQTGGHL